MRRARLPLVVLLFLSTLGVVSMQPAGAASTIGFTNLSGAIADKPAPGYKFGTVVTLPSAGKLLTFRFYAKGGSLPQKFTPVVYAASPTGTPGSLLAKGAEVTVAPNRAAGWVTSTLPAVTMQPNKYVLGLLSGPTGTASVHYTAQPSQSLWNENTYPTPSSTWGQVNAESLQWLFAVDYEPSGPTVTTVAPTTTTTQAPTTTTTPPTTVPPGPAGLPTPQSTGWQHTGVTLRSCEQYLDASVGRYVIYGSAAGTVVDGCDFSSGKTVRIGGGGPVTLKRSRVVAMGGDGSIGILVMGGAGPVVIEDVEITSTDKNNASTRLDRTIQINKDNSQPVTVRRAYIHDNTRGMDFTRQTNVLVQDSYLAFNYNPPVGSNDCGQERPHASVVRMAGGSSFITLRNNVMGVGACAFTSGIIATYPEQGANHDILIEGGMWIIRNDNGGSYGIAAGYSISGGEEQNYGFTVRNVQISTQAYSTGCPSGCGQRWNSSSSSVGPLGSPKVWENNTKYNPGQPDHGQLVNPS